MIYVYFVPTHVVPDHFLDFRLAGSLAGRGAASTKNYKNIKKPLVKQAFRAQMGSRPAEAVIDLIITGIQLK